MARLSPPLLTVNGGSTRSDRARRRGNTDSEHVGFVHDELQYLRSCAQVVARIAGLLPRRGVEIRENFFEVTLISARGKSLTMSENGLGIVVTNDLLVSLYVKKKNILSPTTQNELEKKIYFYITRSLSTTRPRVRKIFLKKRTHSAKYR